jgi:hypothetical protein
VTGWFSVRCVFALGCPPEGRGQTYEERITVWRTSSADEAIVLAEAEALQYATEIEESPRTYLGLAQAYHLFDEPGHGAEVFSLIRDSSLEPDEYLDTFFDTGSERQSSS